jgi:hypothetical protein
MTLVQRKQVFGSHTRKVAAVMFLILFAIAYCWDALMAPFWVGNDGWSNLLPIIHYRESLLIQHQFPAFTNLWYGGRYQWQNPLWNFAYLPSTFIWLLFPLDWGTRLVYFLHLVFALLAGRALASHFSENEINRASSALILCSPILPALTAGQTEKILAWGWILLAIYFLLDNRRPQKQKGFLSGICLGIIPLTGANYYTLYAGIALGLLVLSFKDVKLLIFFASGSLIGLIHFPSVVYLVGYSRGEAAISIPKLSLSLAGILTSLAIGLAKPMGWETWAPVGIPTLYLFFRNLFARAGALVRLDRHSYPRRIEVALLAGILTLALLATGIAYQGHHFLDLFRVPSRSIAVLAILLTVYVLATLSNHESKNSIHHYLWMAAVQITIVSFMIRPSGTVYGPYDPEAHELARMLKMNGAESIWISSQNLNDMYIHAALNLNDIRLPNVYYGDMGQQVSISGDFCGYSFDHLMIPLPVRGTEIELVADMEWSHTRGRIPLSSLRLIRQVDIHGTSYNIYAVQCNQPL